MLHIPAGYRRCSGQARAWRRARGGQDVAPRWSCRRSRNCRPIAVILGPVPRICSGRSI